jgi:hypothetical protein
VKEILHQLFFLSSRKYFKFCVYFAGWLAGNCGKLLPAPVENSVENFASRFRLEFKNFTDFAELRRRLWKIPKSRLKNNFSNQKKILSAADFDGFFVKNTSKIKIVAEILRVSMGNFRKADAKRCRYG